MDEGNMVRKRSLKKSKRGVFFTIDAMIAASIIVLGLILASSFYISEKKPTSISYLASDMTQVMSSLRISEVNNSYVNQLIADGVIEEKSLNNSIAEILGEMWATNSSEIAFNLTMELIDPLMDTRFGYGIYINDEEIMARAKEVKGALISSQKMISGIEKDKAIFGYSSKVYLSSIKDRQTSSFAYFGGFEGEGNLTKRVLLPDSFNITSAYLELEAGTDFKLYVNGNLCSEFPLGSGNGSYMIPDRWDINLSECNTSFFAAGVNNISINFEEINENFTADGPHYIGGGYFRVTYISDNTTDLEVSYDNGSNAIKRYYFPGIDGYINLYSSFYVPGNLSEMNINLSYSTGGTIALIFGNVTIYENTSAGNTTLILNNTEIESILINNSMNYSDLSAKTTPLRLYLKTVLESYFDIVLATDISGSMDYRLDSDVIGVKRDCNDSMLNDPSTRRISGARCAAKAMIDNVLSYTGPLMGLIGYEDVTQDIFTLSDNATELKKEIDDYVMNGGTCICCGVKSAAEILMVDKIKTAISRKSQNWRYNDKDLAAPPAGWTTLGFNDNSWKKKPTVFRNMYNWLGNPSTILAKYEGDYFFRKKFTVTNVSAINDSKLYVLSDDGADVYLNGVLIDNDYNSSHNAFYWNRDRISINTSLFVEGENIIAARLHNEKTCFWMWCWPTHVAFDLELIISETEINQTKLKAIIVMTDGEANYKCDGFFDVAQAKQDAIDAACNVYEDYGIRVFTIGFGSSAEADTLIAMANCSEGEYFNSSSVDELIDAYEQITKKMVEFTSTQTANISSLPDAHLYPESYIEFNYTPITTPPTYGEIPITIESPIFNNNISEGSIYIPNDVDLISLSATSYSGDKWTSYLNVSNSDGVYEVFNLSSYNQDFHDLGDAYQVNIPVNLIKKGEYNVIDVMNGIDSYNLSGGSSYNRLIYTVMLDSLLDFSGVFSSNEGCNWSLAFEDGTNSSLLVPLTYNGTKNCDYLNGTYDTDDATDEAAYRLF
ncbi:MAG: VWA domain-containing protein, partial [Nanoarchaeota archaeon]|nr:VWA domain-containing protein [Nanoarchaeota archaeon]